VNSCTLKVQIRVEEDFSLPLSFKVPIYNLNRAMWVVCSALPKMLEYIRMNQTS